MNESDLDRAKEGDLDLGTEEGGIGVEEGETGAETVEAEEIEVGRREIEAETETGEKAGRRNLDIDLEKEEAAGVAIEVDDLEVQLHAIAHLSKPKTLTCSICRLVYSWDFWPNNTTVSLLRAILVSRPPPPLSFSLRWFQVSHSQVLKLLQSSYRPTPGSFLMGDLEV